MRLLRRRSNGALSLTEDLRGEDSIPPYAILSHTWGPDTQEVTFEDLANDTGRHKKGYEKILLCEKQARQDSLQYFWVDTCCINKADKVELRNAINSMFRWYRDAARCYVYLSDVSGSDAEGLSFRNSRWFTRGWTLQELLAPTSVEFFSEEWQSFGDKISLIQHIHEVTGIPHLALEGAPLATFSVNERLSWNEHRQTRHDEDKAYSMLGIFGVYISPIYGEGTSGAFGRLMGEIDKLNKCIQDLHITNPHDDKKRIEETKGGLQKDSYCWVLNNMNFQRWRVDPQCHLLWIKGDPGKGKTMLLCGIIDELKRSTAGLLSFFFCQATDTRINSATAVLRGLIYLLISQQPSLGSHLRKKYDQAGSSLFQDTNAWIALSDIFISMAQDPELKISYLVVDALDECVVDLPKLLGLIVRTTESSARIKWLVSSRNEAHIEQKLKSIGNEAKLSLELKQNAEQIARAVDVYIDFKLSCLESLEDDSLREQVRDELRHKANGTFLWVALVIQELERQLEEYGIWEPLAVVKEMPESLHDLYDRMMDRIQRVPERYANTCRLLLCTTAVAYRPLFLAEMGSLRELLGQTETVRKIVTMCGSFLTIRHEQIYLVHQSAKDYLSGKMAVTALPSQSEMHYGLFSRSLELMSSTLKRDMYNLVELGFPIDEVKTSTPDPLATARYSCVHWVDHLYDSALGKSASDNKCLQDDNAVHTFLKQRYLYWLESLSLCRCISTGVVSMTKLATLVQRFPGAHVLPKLIHDAKRFIMYHRVGIENSPLQAYASALLFSPTVSLVRRHFQHEEPEWISIKPAMGDGWSACLQTFEGHSDGVKSVTFSHDSTRLASASSDSTVKIWDASSGACLQTLEGHGGVIISVALSHNSTRLTSASNDGTVKIWDASSGACLQTLEGHSSWINSVAFSHDSTWLASASNDSTVKIWDASSGACLQKLEGHSGAISSAVFSHNSTRLASASHDKTIKVWDASSGACLQTLKGHSGAISSIVFSHDSTWLASASNDGTVKIWDTSSGACLQTLEGHSDVITSVTFSHGSTRLASASNNSTIRIWDASSGACLQKLEGHSGAISSVVFSHNSTWLASASYDSTVKLWDVSSGACLQTLEGHSSWINSVAFSHDSTQLVSASEDKTVKVWDASSEACLQTLEVHSSWISSVVFSHDSTRLASASHDKTIKVWDASSGACLQTLKGHSDVISSVAFSHDSTWLASASYDGTVKIWDMSSGACLQTLKTGRSLHHISFDANSSLLRTELGVVAIGLPTVSKAKNISERLCPQYRCGGVSSDGKWITYNTQNMLWLPSEYRPSMYAVSGKNVGIGVGAGRVWICSFKDSVVAV